MNTGRLIFAQLLDFFPMHEFNRCVRRYRGDFHCRSLTCYEQFLCLAFAQLTGCESLRQIETCLEAMEPKLYHAGLRAAPARSTLADANEKRPWEIFADFAHVLIREAVELYAGEEFGEELKQMAYALDSTTIDLCLALFPWAKFRRHKAAIKLHTLLDLHGCIPTLVIITSGKVHDVNILDQLVCEAGAFYGTSENAVKTQIWIAISVYVLVAIIKKRLHLSHSLYTILQILNVTLFEKMPISTALFDVGPNIDTVDGCNQLQLFDL